MNAIYLVEVEILPALSLLGYLLVLIFPIIILLLIARFRGFFASIFFLPLSLSAIYFASSFQKVMNQLNKIGLIGDGIRKGVETCNNLYVSVHYGIFSKLAGYIDVDFIKNILNSTWFGLVLYLILFVVFFALCKKRKRKKEEDLF